MRRQHAFRVPARLEVIYLNGACVLRSQRFVFPASGVIRLVSYIDVRGRQGCASTKRVRILTRDRHRCQYCGAQGTGFDLTIDHIIPRSRGGRTVPENLCAVRFACNQRKGGRTPEQARMPLLSNPSALTYDIERAALRQAAQSRLEWQKYLFLDDARTGTA